ncbi:pentatricopeptide repeat-containing protein [Tanacetum coccineum]
MADDVASTLAMTWQVAVVSPRWQYEVQAMIMYEVWSQSGGDKMPKSTTTDISLTKSYIPKVSKIPGISPTIAQFYKPIENRNIHEGCVVDQVYYKSNNIERLFTNIRFNCLFQINEPIVARFILDFYSQVTGYVGNKSVVFPPQLLGYDVDPIMSVKFLNHTGKISDV